ncbi:MAG: putative bifunctional diguanylate cyclase/phosphodiesterase [Thainema sp.]
MPVFRPSWIERVPSWIKPTIEFRGRSILLSGLITTTILTVCQTFRLTEPLELFLFDQGIRLIQDQEDDPRLLVVGITDEDVAAYGWPLPEETLADLLENLQQHEPRIIGLDLFRTQAQSEKLTAQLKEDNLIAISKIDENGDFLLSQKSDLVPRKRIGFSDLLIDPDSIVRRSLLFVNVEEPTEPAFYSFALRAVLSYLNIDETEFRPDKDSLHIQNVEIPILRVGDGGYQNIDDGGYQMLLRYRDRISPAPQLSLDEVLNQSFDPALVRDKIVLIGGTDASSKDEFYTPYSAVLVDDFVMPGVVVHAQIISHLLDIVNNSSRTVYWFLPVWLEPGWLFIWAILAGIITWRIRRPVFLLFASILLIAAILGVSHSLLLGLIWVPTAELILGILMAVGLNTGQRLLYQSAYDELTQLPKRDLFVNLVHKALQQQQNNPGTPSVIIAFLEIERINLINKSLGYRAGDRVLTFVTEQLKQDLPFNTQVARIGDSEFAILFKQNTQAAVQSTLEQLQDTLSKPMTLDKHRLLLTPHLGVSIAQGQQSYDPDNLIRNAHLAMYQSKASSQAKHTFFSTSMLTENVHRLQLESDLLTAVEQEQFHLAYQPIVCLKSNTIAGFEALVRWQQANGSFISPTKFIPIAEETGLILLLGEWVFRTACQQLQHWKAAFPDQRLVMSINLSSCQFSQPNLIQMIRETLESLNLQGQDIRLEITESMVMEDIHQSIQLMMQFRELGIQLGIDDFGTGYSSLSYLHRLPFDTLKIDKSFVGHMESNREDYAIVNTILDLGHSLNINVVAEGVETLEQVKLLQQHQCQYGQGYFFARPLDAVQATKFLHESRWMKGRD